MLLNPAKTEYQLSLINGERRDEVENIRLQFKPLSDDETPTQIK